MPPETSRLAVDLSGSSIRVLEGNLGGPMRCGSAALPDGAASGGRIIDPVAVGQAIKQLLARTEITTTRALVAAGDAVATFRVLYLRGLPTDSDVGAAVARELAFDPERLETAWQQVFATEDGCAVYAVAWDRAMVNTITDTVKHAGLDATVLELKSASLARTVADASCVILDLASDPAEIVLVDRHMPRLWHGFQLEASMADDLAAALAPPLRSVIRFYKRGRDSGFGPHSPVLVSGEQGLSAHVLAELEELVNQPVQALAAPPRVPPNVRHSTYLACLGLIMRRGS